MTITTSGEKKGTIIYCSHGGGPLPILGEKSHAAMVEFIEQLPASINPARLRRNGWEECGCQHDL
ncbi:MAG: hypothetical protein WGN25_13440 [Candidatus Electrothrix sp. GW3-4]|uniref:hypothetical protein n=1 Tax=Candidatus Electrothrix sp. GW3-4 TaxID=3126740 RepID=UPI0030CA77BA